MKLYGIVKMSQVTCCNCGDYGCEFILAGVFNTLDDAKATFDGEGRIIEVPVGKVVKDWGVFFDYQKYPRL